MLLQFSVKNFRSFRDEVLLNMRRATTDAETTLDLVPAAAIYGANAAGKSNLVRALDVLRDLVVHGPASKDSPLRVDPFRLASGTRGAPTEFEIYLRVGPRIYGYKVAATRAKILRERLVTVALETLEETTLFDRHQGDFEFTATARESAGVDDPKYLDFIARGTKQNQLLVHEGHERGLSLVEDVYRWFCEALTIILPGSHFAMLEVLAAENPEFRDFLQNTLSWADTGIVSLQLRRRKLDENLKERVENILRDPQARTLLQNLRPNHGSRRQIIHQIENDEAELLSLEATHRGDAEGDTDGTTTLDFDFSDESDGTNRLLDLAPMLYFAGTGEEEDSSDPRAQRPVFVVDELDRSLHTLLAQRLVQTFVELAGESRVPGASPQLIFTTHDTNLLDCTSLSADGIWFTEKGPDGASTLYSLAEFDPEQLQILTGELEKGYLQGRFGGIPFLGDTRRLGWPRGGGAPR